MNNLTKLMQNRRSIRNYNDKKITDAILEDILLSARQAPSSINAQQSSLIVIQDQEKLQKIEDICGGYAQTSQSQAFIIVAMDFYKTNVAIERLGKQQYIHQSIEGILTGAVDVGIMVEAISLAAESYGIGNTIIGAIRNDPQQIIDICELPQYTFPVVGIMLGYPKEQLSEPKKRLNKDTFIHKEVYSDKNLIKNITEYDNYLDNMNKKRNLSHLKNYSEQLALLYTYPRLKQVNEVLHKQGFDYK